MWTCNLTASFTNILDKWYPEYLVLGANPKPIVLLSIHKENKTTEIISQEEVIQMNQKKKKKQNKKNNQN